MGPTVETLKHDDSFGCGNLPRLPRIFCAAALIAFVLLNWAASVEASPSAHQTISQPMIAAAENQNEPPKAAVPEKKTAEPEKPAKQSLADKIAPPHDSAEKFVQFMKEKRKEDPTYLEQRYNRYLAVIENKDLWREKEGRAFLLTPREKFCRKWNLKRAYDHAFLDIKYGVTISGPHLVSRMTSALDVQPGEKVLEIGTGSGYQSAVISYLTDQVYTIEIIEKLAEETNQLYKDLAASGYPEYDNIKRKADDGYYGWEEYGPFDKIIVTCGIDHIPPPLLKQLKVGGSMVIPVGPPGAQIVMKVTKNTDQDGNVVIAREDIYHGQRKVPFVPFTKKGGGTHFNK
jgi:protein-L-isoaspartate(D-aspartate) O-methyltransferase